MIIKITSKYLENQNFVVPVNFPLSYREGYIYREGYRGKYALVLRPHIQPVCNVDDEVKRKRKSLMAVFKEG